MRAADIGREAPDSLRTFLAEHRLAGHWPGAVIAVGAADEVRPRWVLADGARSLVPHPEPLSDDTLYDLASLTKPLVTGLLALRLSDLGRLDIDAPLELLLPETRGYAGRTPSIGDLLSHRAGFPAWVPIYRRWSDARGDLNAVAHRLARLTPRYRAGEDAVYSCPSALLAGLALERATGVPLRDLAINLLLEPLELGPRSFSCGPLEAPLRELVAPTEWGRRREIEIGDGEPAPAPGFAHLEGPLRGEVHDGNAWFLGGFAGNAGAFASAEAVYALARQTIAEDGLLSPGARCRCREVMARGTDVRTFGFQAACAPGAPSGRLGEGSFGHVGFTGTSLWVDPDGGRIAVLLTNRIHPEWTDQPIQAWRRAFHDLVADLPSV